MREILRDFLNGYLGKENLIAEFDIKQCQICDGFELSSDMEDTEGLPNGGVGEVCPSCKQDME